MRPPAASTGGARAFEALVADQARFRTWYDHALPRVYGYLLARCGDPKPTPKPTPKTTVETPAPTATPRGAVHAGNPTPAPQLPDTAVEPADSSTPLIGALALVLLLGIGSLAWRPLAARRSAKR